MSSNQNFVISLSAANTKSKTEVGVPALELSELISANVPIPGGFVITQPALEFFAYSTQLDQKVKQLQQIGSFGEATLTKLILESELPREIYTALSREYTTLSGISNVWLRIRAGLYDNEGNPLTYIDENEINEVKGFEALELELKKTWAKLLIIDQKYDSLGSFVIVQKLVPAEVSGIILTQDQNANDPKHILIKSMFGEFNDDFVDFLDTYTFSKDEERIIEREIKPQYKMHIRSTKSDFGFEEIEISDKWQLRQKLSDKYIEDLGYLGDYLENVFTKPQEVQWVFQAGKIWINYVKPITDKYLNTSRLLEENIEKDYETISAVVEQESENFEDQSVDINLPENVETISELPEEEQEIQEELSQNENTEKIENNLPEIENLPIPELPESVQLPDINVKLNTNDVIRDVLLAGIGNNNGVIEGKIVFNREESTSQDILVLPSWDDMPKNAAAIVLEDIVSVSAGIPLIYGAEMATKILREGEFVKLDTDTGFIFELTEQQKTLSPVVESDLQQAEIDNLAAINESGSKEELHEETVIEEKITETKESRVEAVTEDEEIAVPEPSVSNKEQSATKEEIHTAIKVLANVSNNTKEEISYTDGYLLELPHATDYLLSKENIDYKNISTLIYNYVAPLGKNKKSIVIYNITDINPASYIKNSDLLEVQLESIHKLRNKENMRHLHVALPKFKNLKQLREFRKSLSGCGLRRSTTFKIYIKLSYSSNIFELPSYLEDRFDGVIVNIEALQNSLYSSDKKVIRITNTLLKALAQIQKECRNAKVPMILNLKGVKLTKSVLQKLDPYISFGISVLPKYTEFAKRHIATLEKERIFR